MTNDNRRHKRFKPDVLELYGKMVLAQKVEILDISRGGVSLKTDRRLNIDREYQLKLESKGKKLDVRSTVVRCELIGVEAGNDGESVSIYRAAVMFKDASSQTLVDFMNSIELDKKETISVSVDQRHTMRFQITTPCRKTLIFPTQFKVKVISLGGILIQTEQVLELESMIPMELSLQDNHISFIGRVASYRVREGKEQEQNEIGIEFKDLTDKDRTLLNTFIDYLAMIETKTGSNKIVNNEVVESNDATDGQPTSFT